MSNNFSRFKRTAIFLMGAIVISAPSTVAADWSIIGLGTLGGTYSAAKAVNDFGQVVGNGVSRAFITGPDGIGINYLDTLGGGRSYAADINNAGQVVGYSLTGDGLMHAFITTGTNGVGMKDLGTLGGDYSAAYGINSTGRVVGVSSTAGNAAYHAFITGPDGVGMTDLGVLGGSNSTAYSINDAGRVAGVSFTSDLVSQHAFITGPDGVGMIDLGTLGSTTDSTANDINNLGQVVGFSGYVSDFLGFHSGQAFATDMDGTNMTGLSAPTDRANGINDIGQIVGGINSFCDFCSNHSSFLYSDGVITDLSLLDSVVAAGWSELSAVGINNHGQIVGWGYLEGSPGGGSRAFLLSPVIAVPEPKTYGMLLTGLGLVCFVLSRRKLADPV